MPDNKLSIRIAAAFGCFALLAIGMGLSTDDGQEPSTFESEAHFKAYINSVNAVQENIPDGGSGSSELNTMDARQDVDSVESPSMVLSDEENIYVSRNYPRHFHTVSIPELGLVHNESDLGGELLQTNNTVIMRGAEGLAAYNKESLDQEWSANMTSRIVELEKAGDTLVLLTRENIDYSSPCPVRPMEGVKIACSSILRPYYGGQIDYTYHLSVLDVNTGEELESTAFTASSRTAFEVAPEQTYVAHNNRVSESEVLADFILDQVSDSQLVSRVEELQGYDISDRSMQIELQAAIESYGERSGEGALKDFNQRFKAYDAENMRDYAESTILQINNSDLEDKSENVVEGRVAKMEFKGGRLLIQSNINGIEYENRETDLLIQEKSSITFEENVRAELTADGVIVNENNGLTKFDSSFEEIGSWDEEFSGFETMGNKTLVMGRSDDGAQKITVLGDKFEELDALTLDDTWLYSMPLETVEEYAVGITNTAEGGQIIAVDRETGKMETHDTDVSGQIVAVDGQIYVVGPAAVYQLDESFEVEEEVTLETGSNGIRPLPEPRPMN